MARSMIWEASRAWPATRELSPPVAMELRKPALAVPRLLAATDWMPKPTCWRLLTLGPIWKLAPPPVMTNS